nr:bulb-type lectin domain-containing protein [Tanacetum cinerariifolium]
MFISRKQGDVGERMKEVEAFNASKMSAKTRDHAKKIASTRKEKRARCYICKERGHVFRKCQNKRKDARIEKQKESVKPTNKNVEEKIKYPEQVYVITEYMIEGTDDATWEKVCIDLLEEQGYRVKISNNKCNLHYMFDEARTGKAQEERLISERIRRVEMGQDDVHDYVDEEYISWNGSLYAIKVEMLKWFYLVHLNYDMLEGIQPVIGVMEINLLGLHKTVDGLGGYLCVTLGDKWKTIENLQSLTDDDREVVKGCYKKFIDMVQVYYETTKMPWYEKKPKGDVV